jgi:predicted nucleic acid-binding protein
MMVLVDTCVWSLALRRDRPPDCREVREFEQLIRDSRIQMLGPIRQEILSGVCATAQFDSLREHLEAFPDLPLETEDYVTAASVLNRCRAKGVQGSNTDFLICSVAARHGLAVYTTDADFALFAAHLPIVLHREGGAERAVQ